SPNPTRPGACPRPSATSEVSDLDGVPGRFGDVLASGRRGPPHVPAGQVLGPPPRILLQPVVMAAPRVPVAQAGPAARLVGDGVLAAAARRGRRPPRPGTGRGADLGQVPQPPPGIMSAGLVPVVAVRAGQRLDRDQHVPVPGGEPPGSVLAGGGEGEPGVP